MAPSRVGSSFKLANLRLISCFHSGMFGSGDAIDGSHKRLPGAALRRQHLFAFGRQFVITPPPLTGLLHPSPSRTGLPPPPPFDPPTFPQPIQKRIERSDVESQLALRPRLDQFADVIAVPLPYFEKRED